MSSPPQQPRPSATATSPPPPAATAAQPLPRAFLATAATSSPRRAAAAAVTPAPPLFTARALNPNPSHAASTAAHGILYPVATSAAGNHRRAPAVPVGYPRAHAVAVPIAQQQQNMVPTQARSFPAAPRAVVAGVTSRPEQPPRGVPIAPQAQPKVNQVPDATLSHQEISNLKDSERIKEDSTTVVINDRKVNLLDSESGSLYVLCRSWVRNGVRHESQPSFGTCEPILPRPLPASVVDSRISEKEIAMDNEDSEEQKNETFEYTTSNLLKQHVKRAKKIRAGLQKERLRRIERYKQRLALLLPPPSELGKHDGHP